MTRELKDCPLCGSLRSYDPEPIGSWPAFYVRGPVQQGSILWIGIGGSVENGGWKPNFSEDRSTCWYGDDVERAFTWIARAPMSGNYNNVIEKFRLEHAPTTSEPQLPESS